MNGLRGHLALLTAMLLMLCGLWGAAAAQEPSFASTRAFVAMLRQADVPFEAQGVDEYGEECLKIPLEGVNLYCFFTADGAEVCFVAWYLIEYAPGDGPEVMKVCNRLNAVSDGPRFCVDESDHSVTAMMEVPLPWNAAGDVAWQGFRCMADLLQEARRTLLPLCPAPAVTPQPEETAPPATPAPVPTAPSAPSSPVQSGYVVVTAASARVRSGPGVTSPYLFTAQQGERFPLVGVSGDWYIIISDGRTGFLSKTVAAPVP